MSYYDALNSMEPDGPQLYLKFQNAQYCTLVRKKKKKSI